MSPVRSLACFFAVLAPLVMLACSGDSASGAPDGGGPWIDAGGGTPEPQAQSPFCAAVVAYDARCLASCTSGIGLMCPSYELDLSDLAKSAYITCAAGAACGAKVSDDTPVELCVKDALLKAAPTASQQSFANDWCSICKPAESACPSSFFSDSWSAPIIGKASDSAIASMKSVCMPKSGSCDEMSMVMCVMLQAMGMSLIGHCDD